jgi:hypothetical protein
MSEVIILTDFILKSFEPPRGSKHIATKGATINVLIKKIKYRSIIVTGFKVCIISIGTIDIANLEYHVFLPRYSELLYTIRRKNPKIDIIICAILPRPADHEISKPMVARANFLLEDLC